MRDIMRRKESFSWKTFIKQVSVIAVPVALQNLLTTTGSMVDTMMLAPLGQLTVGAVGLCAQFASLLFSGYWGFVGGGMLFFSQYYGAEDDDGIKRSYGITLLCMMTVSLLFAIAALFFPEWIMGIYTDKTSIREIGVRYLRIVGFAYPFQVYSMAMSALLRSTERVRIPLYASIVSVGTNIFLNWVLIGGHLGMPALGIQGAAIATVCAAVMNVLVIVIASRIIRHPHIFSFRGHFRWRKDFLNRYFRKCAPILANEIAMGVGNMLINMVLGRQSEEAIAATAVFRTLEGLVIGFFSGFSNAASILVGKEVGAGNPDLAQKRAKRLVYLCAGLIFTICAILVCVNRPILRAMSLSGESLSIGAGMLMIYAVAATIRMSNWVQNDTFRAAGDAAFGTILEITFMFILVLPCVYYVGMLRHLQFLLVFACCYIDEPIRFALMHRHLYSLKWIKPVTQQGQEALLKFNAERKNIKR